MYLLYSKSQAVTPAGLIAPWLGGNRLPQRTMPSVVCPSFCQSQVLPATVTPKLVLVLLNLQIQDNAGQRLPAF